MDACPNHILSYACYLKNENEMPNRNQTRVNL